MSSITIAYSHKGGFWKTKYSYLSSWFAKVGRAFYSGKASAVEEPVWKHNSNAAPRTAYYMASGGTPIGSGISVSFNKNVSQNKIYKSFSIEGSNNIVGANSFVVNSDSGYEKTSSVGPIKDKGGILYGHIGLSPVTLDGSNIAILGEITSDVIIDADDDKVAYFYMKGQDLSSTGLATKFFFMQDQAFYDSATGASLDISAGITSTSLAGSSGSIRPSAEADPTEFSEISGGREVKFTGLDADAVTAFKTAVAALQSPSDAGRLFVYQITLEAINGAPPRGQYAQLNVGLGSAPYELYALNLNYEPTDLDHSK